MDSAQAPLYVTVGEAARLAGIGEKEMRGYVNSSDPPPMLVVGRKRLVQAARLADYLESKQEVRWAG